MIHNYEIRLLMWVVLFNKEFSNFLLVNEYYYGIITYLKVLSNLLNNSSAYMIQKTKYHVALKQSIRSQSLSLKSTHL